MPISFGGSNIGSIYVGGTPIKEVYSGSTLVWSSGPSWPQSGTWSGNTTSTAATLDTFTVTEAGVYDLEWAVTWAGAGSAAGKALYRVNSGIPTGGNTVIAAPGTSTVNGSGVALSAGDVVEFRAESIAATRPATGAWVINKISPIAYGTYNVTDPANGNYNVGTWATPSAGTYTLYIDRLSIDHPATVIVVNGSPVSGPEVAGTPRTRTVTRSLSSGDTVTFRVAASPGSLRPATGTWYVR